MDALAHAIEGFTAPGSNTICDALAIAAIRLIARGLIISVWDGEDLEAREQMALAANRLRDVGGGITLFKDSEELAMVELPIAGLMSDSPATQVAAKADQMMQAMRDCGCKLNNAYMQHSLLALVVIPELRISDLGLVDVRTFEFTDVIVK